jgi:hypothetical protein
MTSRRYDSYRRALDLVGAVGPQWLTDPARVELEDLVEQMLLSRDERREQVRKMREDASVAIRELAGAGMLPPTLAEELVGLVLAAGPPLTPRQQVA